MSDNLSQVLLIANIVLGVINLVGGNIVIGSFCLGIAAWMYYDMYKEPKDKK